VIGYPFSDARLPPFFVTQLLGQKPGEKRLLPGCILAFNKESALGLPATEKEKAGAAPRMIFATDVSTTSGTGGGPIIDLATDEVVGVHYGGLWRGERGKMAYGLPLSKSILDYIHPAAKPDSPTPTPGQTTASPPTPANPGINPPVPASPLTEPSAPADAKSAPTTSP
jgi:hypothetical protein